MGKGQKGNGAQKCRFRISECELGRAKAKGRAQKEKRKADRVKELS